MSKLCLIYNFAPKYREAIFKAIDERWECEWYFGKNATDIKGMDLNVLKDAQTVANHTFIRLPWYTQKHIFKLAGRKDISTFFMLGDLHCITTWLTAVRLRLFSPKKKLYFWTHGWYGKESKPVAMLKKLFFSLADGIFLYGNHARDLMIENGFSPDKLYVIHNSLNHAEQIRLRAKCSSNDTYRNHFGNDNPVLIFIGRLTQVKRLDMLMEALAGLKKEGKSYNLVLIGDGEQSESLKALAKSLDIEDSVWFYGACYDDTENAELIFNADLCVAPGNVGLTAMHTMVFGTPVISHDDFKWQMPEFEAIKPGKTGDFFKFGDVGSLASKISEWFDSHPDRDAVRRECYKEIDSGWNPEYQMEVLENNLIVE